MNGAWRLLANDNRVERVAVVVAVATGAGAVAFYRDNRLAVKSAAAT